MLWNGGLAIAVLYNLICERESIARDFFTMSAFFCAVAALYIGPRLFVDVARGIYDG